MWGMNPKNRKVIFYAFFALFLIVGAYLLIAANGWNIDFSHFRFLKTGGLFLKFSPTDAVLTINEEIREFSKNFLTNGVLIKNLVPKDYEVVISKTGFQTWNKKLKIEPDRVPSADYIRLWPTTFKDELIFSGPVKNFWLTEKGLVYQTKDGSLHFEKITLKGKEVIKSDPKSKLLITFDEPNHFAIDLEEPLAAVNINQLFNSLRQRQLNLKGTVAVKDYFFHPFSPNKVILASKNGLYSLDLKKIQLELLFANPEELESIAVSNNEIIALDVKNNLIVNNLFLKTTATSSIFEAPLTSKSGLAGLNREGTKIFMKNPDNKLAFYDRNSKKLIEIGDNVRDFHVSTEGKRLALISETGELKIYYLSEYADEIKKSEAGSVEVVAASGLDAESDFSWLPDLPNYGLVLNNNNLFAQEIRDYLPFKSYPLVSKINKYVPWGELIYLLKENGELSKIEPGF